MLYNYFSQIKKSREKINLNQILKYAKTGDLLFFRHRNPHLCTTLLLGGEFSHIGIVLMKHGKLYVCETISQGELLETTSENKISQKKFQELDQKMKIKKTPLLERLLYYPCGYVCVKFLNKPLDYQREKMLFNYYKQQKKIPFCPNFFSYRSIPILLKCYLGLDKFINKQYDNCHICSSFISGAIKSMNITNDNLSHNICFKPTDIHNYIQNIQLNNNYKYSQTYEIDIDN
jgi:hypothetical protein